MSEVRVELEHVVIWDETATHALLYALRKPGWGKLVRISDPLPDDPPRHPYRITYMHKPSSPYRQRFEGRQQLKVLLRPAKATRLVSWAMRFSQRRFIEMIDSANEDLRAVLEERCNGMTPQAFWRATRGTSIPRTQVRATQ